MHHYMGIEMNNQTWKLLGEKDRNELDDARMVNFDKHHYTIGANHPYKSRNKQRSKETPLEWKTML